MDDRSLKGSDRAFGDSAPGWDWPRASGPSEAGAVEALLDETLHWTGLPADRIVAELAALVGTRYGAEAVEVEVHTTDRRSWGASWVPEGAARRTRLVGARDAERVRLSGQRIGGAMWVRPARPWTSLEQAEAALVAGRAAAALDARELLAATDEQRLSLDELRLVTDALPALVAYVDPQGRYLLTNATYARWFERREGELIGRHVREVTGAAVWEILRPRLERAMRGERVQFQFQMELPGKGLRWLESTYTPHMHLDGRPIGVIALVSDVTDKKQTEDALAFLAAASAALTGSLDWQACVGRLARLAVPALADWCVVHARDDEGRWATETACDAPELQGVLASLAEAYGPEAPPEGDRFAAVARTGRSVLIERVEPEDREAFARSPEHLAMIERLGVGSLMGVPLVAGERVLGVAVFGSRQPGRCTAAVLAVAEELGRRAGLAFRNAQLHREAQRAVRSRDELLSAAAHELKNPLHALGLQVASVQRAARRDGSPPELSWLLERIDKAGAQVGRLAGLVDELLDVSRITAGRLRVALEDVELGAVVREVAQRKRDAGLSDAITVVAPEPVVGRWDRLRLDQVATNLLSNAVKYGQGEPITVEVVREGEVARLTVRDRGLGIAPAEQARIFERFERAVSSRHYGGFGLGLWITRQVVEALGGSIEVDSRPGEGATFTVRLPVAGPAEAEAVEREEGGR